MKFTIGRASDNIYRIENISVSNHHAELQIVDDFSFILKDLGSSGGTYVNDTKIISKKINLTEKIILGKYNLNNQELLSYIQNFTLQNRTDFSKEFQELETKYKEYSKKISKIERGQKNKPLIIKLFITIALMGVTFIVTGGNFGPMMIIGVLSGIITNFMFNNTGDKEKKEEIFIEFSKSICCPKCKKELLSKSWKYWKSKGECPNLKCDAKW